MKKYIFTTFIALIMALPAYASEVTGTITTGVNTGVDGYVVEKPTATPPAGSYSSAQSVVLSGGDGTSSIHYTTDGSAATCSSGYTYTSAIDVSSTVVIEAISCYPNSIDSGVILFGYTIDTSGGGGGGGGSAPSGGGGGGGGGGIVTTPTTSNFDFNTDGNIDVFDFNILMSNWGTSSGASTATGDADLDGDVDIFDFNLLIANWQS